MDRPTWILFAAGSCGVLASTPVAAAESGFYFSVGVGVAEENPGASKGFNFGFEDPAEAIFHLDPYRVDVEGGDVGWSAAVGYRISRYVSAEVEYLDFGTTDITEYYNAEIISPALDILPFPYSSSVQGPAVSLLGTLPVGNGFELFMRAGALFAERKIGMPGDEGSGSFSDTVWLGGVGAGWSFASHWAIRAEYQRSGDLDTPAFFAPVGETAVQSVSLRLRYEL